MKRVGVLLSIAGGLFAQSSHLDLAAAEKLAVQNHPALASQKFTAGAAHEVAKQYHAQLGPQFAANFTAVGADDGSRLAAGGLNNPIVYNRFGSGMSVTQTLYDFGRNSNLAASAKLRAEAQDRTADQTRAVILLETDRAYFGLLGAQALLKVAESTVQARQLVVDQVSALAQAKIRSALDVSFAKVNLADAQLFLTKAQNDVQSARARLATAMGLPGDMSFIIEETDAVEPLPDQVAPLLAEAMRDRPDVASLRLESGAADRNAKAQRALMFPSVGLFASAGFVPATTALMPGQFGAIGVNVSVPVYNGGLYSAERNEAYLRAHAAQQDVTDLENRVARDVRVAYNDALTAYERIHLTAQMLDQAKTALDLAQSRYDLGLSSMIELNQAQLNLTSAQIAASQARYDYEAQRRVLEYAIGALR